MIYHMKYVAYNVQYIIRHITCDYNMYKIKLIRRNRGKKQKYIYIYTQCNI